MKTNFFITRLRLAITTLVLGLITTQISLAQDITPEIKKALRLVDIEQSAKGAEAIDALIKANPTNASLWYYLGYIQIKRGELDKALTSFDKGVQVDPKEQLNYVGKGYVRVVQNNLTEAKAIFDKALADTKSKNAAVLNGIGEAYLFTRKNVDAALPLLNKSKSINSKDPETLILLGDALLQQGNGTQGGPAVSSYENAALLDPKNAKPHYKIGIVYSRSKNVDAAVESYKKAIAADPQYAPAYKELGEIYYVAKDGVKAAEAQEKYLALTENPAPGKVQLAFYYFMAKNYTKSNEIFKQIIQTPEIPTIAYRFYAQSLKEAGDLEQSRSLFEQYFQKAKKEEIQAADYVYFGQTLVELKQDSLAIQAFENSLALDSTNIEIRQLHAETLYAKKRYAEAIKSYEKLTTLRNTPSSLDQFNLGRAYYYNGQMVEADTAFNRLIKLQPTRTVGYLWVARVRANSDPESTQGLARPYFEKVIELGEQEPEKNKKDLIDAYSYMGYYYYLQKQNAKSKTYWEKVLKLNPADKRAAEAIQILKKL